MNKKWYQSRTMWVGIITGLAGAGPLVANFTGLVNPLLYAAALTIVGAANMWLRMNTDQGIE